MIINTHQILTYERTFPGQHQPYLVTLDHESESAVVKLICKQGCACFKEYLVICMARKLGMKTLTPIQVERSDEFLASLDNTSWMYTRFQQHKIPAFATYYLPGGILPTKVDFENPVLLPQWIQVFCLDVLIRNVDRRANNPNLLMFSQNKTFQLLILDHEMAFPFSAEIEPSEPNWRLTSDEKLHFQSHCAYPLIKSELKKSFGSTMQMLYSFNAQATQVLSQTVLNEIFQMAPAPWRNQAEYAKISSHVLASLAQNQGFAEMVREVLAS